MQPIYSKMHKKEIPSIGHNVLEFFCAPLHTDYFSDLHKIFLVTSTSDIILEYQI